MAQKRQRTTNLILIGVLILGGILFLLINNWKQLGIEDTAVVGLLIAMWLLVKFIDKPIDRRIKMERRADRGAVAEEVVADFLSDLGDDLLIIHDISSPYGNIDHVVIGISGSIFLIETKAHGGKAELLNDQLLVNGKMPEKNFIVQVLNNTYWLRDEIAKTIGHKAWITPIIVFTNAFVPMGLKVKGVHILNKKYLISTLQRVERGNQRGAKTWEKRYEIFERLNQSS